MNEKAKPCWVWPFSIDLFNVEPDFSIIVISFDPVAALSLFALPVS